MRNAHIAVKDVNRFSPPFTRTTSDNYRLWYQDASTWSRSPPLRTTFFFSSTSNCDDSVNDSNLFLMETGKDSETLDFDPSMTRLVVVEETG
jgi:hypothetical protein